MNTVKRIWKGTGYNKEVRLIEREYDNGNIRYEFRDRLGRPGNPTADEAQEIIKTWKLQEA